ncbi:MAG: hypothetical protein JWN59_26 [Sphingomonas bacterium]|nr:hypothetical protein [Sphingomonas bacterium]
MSSLRTLSFALALSLAGPALAGESSAQPVSAQAGSSAATAPHKRSTSIPEPADVALFAAGVLGLVLGRRGSRSHRD